MLDIIGNHATLAGQRPALVEENGTLTYGDLARQVEAAAAALRRAGLAPGDRLLFWDMGKSAYLIALLACFQEQVALAPLHPQTPLTWQTAVADQLGVAAVAPGLTSLLDGEITLRPGRVRAAETDVLAILMTSGTIGAPKGAPIHAAMAATAARNAAAVFQLHPECCFLDYIPPFTVGGLFLTGLPVLLAGGTSLVRSFSPFAFAGLVAENRPTHAILLPTMAAVLRHTSSWPQVDLACFEAIGSGASTVPESVGQELLAHGAQRFLHLYGSTECLTPVMFHASDVGSSGPYTIFSKLCGDFTARLADDGELLLRGSAVMRGYLVNPALNAESYVDGWFRTGDLFSHADGGWRITGRKKEVLKVGGFSVSPASIEKVILDAPGVRNCAVAVETLRSGGEALVAIVEGVNVEARAVLDRCAAHFPPNQTPRRVMIVDALPLNAMRKVDRQAVQRMIQA
jgi:acyl-CoA synthetase (AMP-forming)/AMP-acid ligase II